MASPCAILVVAGACRQPGRNSGRSAADQSEQGFGHFLRGGPSSIWRIAAAFAGAWPLAAVVCSTLAVQEQSAPTLSAHNLQPGLVNNAADNFIAPTESLSPRGFDAIAGIVFHGSFYVTQAIGKRWVEQAKTGQWTKGQPYRNVMSIIVTWVDNGGPYVVPSAMSKAGIEVMTKSLAVEWARFGIRLNTIGPGEIPIEGMSKRLNPGEEPGAQSIKRNPMARVGQMSELQNLASFLMAPPSLAAPPAATAGLRGCCPAAQIFNWW